jgi:hypothetical protein
LIRNRLTKHCRCHGKRKQRERDHKPLATRQHASLARAVKHDTARRLNGTNPRSRRQQGPDGEEDDKDYDARADAHDVEIILAQAAAESSKLEI